jgi:ribosome maturation factor RimP
MDAAARGIAERVRSVAADAIRAEGAELVDLEFRCEAVGWVLRLFIDKTGGVGVEDCQRVSELVGTLLEVEDPIPHAYTLEVSSPGLTRPLRNPEDWRRSVGSLVKVVTREPVEKRQAFVGRLVHAGPDAVRVTVDGRDIEIPSDLIARARLEVEWPKGNAGKPRGGKARRARKPRGKS